MKYYTHLTFSFLLGILFIKYLSIQNQILFMMVFILFSIIPDIDAIRSKISEKIKPLAYVIKIFLGHRGFVHSIWIPAILYLSLFLMRIDVAFAASFGYLSHILLDSLTPMGIQPVWPIKKKLKGPINTGSLMEHLIFIVFLMLSVYFLFTF